MLFKHDHEFSKKKTKKKIENKLNSILKKWKRNFVFFVSFEEAGQPGPLNRYNCCLGLDDYDDDDDKSSVAFFLSIFPSFSMLNGSRVIVFAKLRGKKRG